MKNLKFLLAGALLSLTISCEKEAIVMTSNTDDTPSEINSNDKPINELAFFEKTGETKKGSYLGMEVTYDLIDDKAVFEGDIILPKKYLKNSSSEFISNGNPDNTQARSTGRTSGRWPNNTVYYEIDRNLPRKNRVYNAIREWESKTSIRFVKRRNQRDYVYFFSGSGCYSSVGKVGGRQEISLAGGCGTGAAIHEIGHAVGLFHEQNRADRDNYLRINYQNISQGMAYNFDTYPKRYGNSGGDEYTNTLDFKSVMLYGPYSFSKNGRPTITRRNGSLYSISRSGLSRGDIQGINKMYPGEGGGDDGDDDGDDDKDKRYKNGQYYVVDGLRVYRYKDAWWYYSKSKRKWHEVVNVNGNWYYKR